MDILKKNTKNLAEVIRERKEYSDNFCKQNNPTTHSDYYQGKNRAHVLAGERCGQVSVGLEKERAIFEPNKEGDHFRFVKYLSDHDYSQVPKPGEVPPYHFWGEHLSKITIQQPDWQEDEYQKLLLKQKELAKLESQLKINKDQLSVLYHARQQLDQASQVGESRGKIDHY
jgi:hypothetical protein